MAETQALTKRSNGRKKEPNSVADQQRDTEYFPRKDAALFLGVSVPTLRYWHKNRVLVPGIERDGTWFYTRTQLEDFREQAPERLAAKAFAMFEKGETPVNVVIALNAHPSQVEQLHELYIRLSSSWRIAGPSGAREVWERTYDLGPLTPLKLRRALELCAIDPALKAKLLAPE